MSFDTAGVKGMYSFKAFNKYLNARLELEVINQGLMQI